MPPTLAGGLHGHVQTYCSPYGETELRDWVRQIRAWLTASRDVYVFFDNTAAGHAPRDAARLAAMFAGTAAAS